MMTARWPTGPPKVAAWGRTTGTAASGCAKARAHGIAPGESRCGGPAGGFPARSVRDWGADRSPWFHGSMVRCYPGSGMPTNSRRS